jgi:hypothetical protein
LAEGFRFAAPPFNPLSSAGAQKANMGGPHAAVLAETPDDGHLSVGPAQAGVEHGRAHSSRRKPAAQTGPVCGRRIAGFVAMAGEPPVPVRREIRRMA